MQHVEGLNGETARHSPISTLEVEAFMEKAGQRNLRRWEENISDQGFYGGTRGSMSVI